MPIITLWVRGLEIQGSRCKNREPVVLYRKARQLQWLNWLFERLRDFNYMYSSV